MRLLSLVLLALAAPASARTTLRFEVTVGKDLLPAVTEGRLLVVLSKRTRPEPRFALGQTGANVPPVLGVDAKLSSGAKAVLDASATTYPIRDLDALPKGKYVVQAVFDHNRDIRLPDAPGNLVSEPLEATIDPSSGGTIALTLSRKLADMEPPADTEHVKFLKFRSEKLTKFHGRPMYLRAGIVLPSGHAKETERRYPLRVHIGGFGSRYTNVQSWLNEGSAYREVWEAKDGPKFIVLHLDGAGPLGDPYQVNSANHGPYGDAITQELIPHVEKTYRGIGKGQARVLDGASTGGWVSLALQIFYPDFFNGAWSHCPDPVDFRAFQLMNIYREPTTYINRHGFERPGARDLNGETTYTMRSEVSREVVLGRGSRWTLSGKDWGSWNATFSPKGDDGSPLPLWDHKTGKIDAKVAEHWKKYDLRLQLEKNHAELAPKLRGKLRIWVGDADEYFLNNAVYLLDDYLKGKKPSMDVKVTYGRRKGHSWTGISEKEMMAQMAAAVKAKE